MVYEDPDTLVQEDQSDKIMTSDQTDDGPYEGTATEESSVDPADAYSQSNVYHQPPPAAPVAAAPTPRDPDCYGKLFLGGVSWNTTEDGLRDHFGKYGKLIDVALMKDKYTGHPRGFGFITFEDERVIDTILREPHMLDGKTIDIKRAVPRGTAPNPSR